MATAPDVMPETPSTLDSNDRLTFKIASAAACFGATFGFIDGGLAGSVGGAGGAFLIAEIVVLGFNSLTRIAKTVISLFQEQKSQSKLEPQGSRVKDAAICVAELAFYVILLHELPVMANIAATVITYNTGAYLTQATARNDSHEYIKDGLSFYHHLHSAINVRPNRWLLHSDTHARTEGALKIVEYLQGKGIEPPHGPRTVSEDLVVELATSIWRSDNWLADKVANATLNELGRALCEDSKIRLPEAHSKGWIIKFIPIDFIVSEIKE